MVTLDYCRELGVPIEPFAHQNADAYVYLGKVGAPVRLQTAKTDTYGYRSELLAKVDGAELGLGTELGISTQRLHARGPMGLTALTSTPYVLLGDGRVRGDSGLAPGLSCDALGGAPG